MENFTTMARLISHLGDQLISNTTVAILELIKNSYDATVASGKDKGYVKIKINQIHGTMIIEDNGIGMTKEDIINKYLVIGTADRLEKKQQIREKKINDKTKIKVPLGEKGLGRFATMKLGEKILLLTKSNNSRYGCLLKINWNEFGNLSKKRLEDVKVHLSDVRQSSLKERGYESSFTKIKIYNLKDFCDKDIWTPKKFEEFYKMNFMKYLNPFKPTEGFQIKLEITTHNNEFYRFYPDNLDRKLLEQAPYQLKGNVNGKQLYFDYYIRGEDLKEHRGTYNDQIPEINLIDFISEGNVGPLEFEMYFYTRTAYRLKEIKGYENITSIRNLLDQYCGGVMVYRDNFRVLPYAEKGNDWLNLDTDTKLRGKGLRFNTIRTVGAVFISTIDNPNLRDQTNREGLITNKAYENLTQLLKATIKTFLNINSEYYPAETNSHKGPISTEDIHNAVNPFNEKFQVINQDLKKAEHMISPLDNEYKKCFLTLSSSFGKLEEEFLKVQDTIRELDDRIIKIDEQQRMIIDLAGIGITVETIAHEMWSYIGRMTKYLKELKREFPMQKDSIDTLIHNTKSLETVISRIDKQTVTKRRTKTELNLLKVIKETCSSSVKIWSTEDVQEISIIWDHKEDCYISANEGMLIQVFDNILNNSHYWLLNHKKDFPNAKLEIHISVNKDGIIEISDTGPGILEIDSKAIFDPFFTRKKDGTGRGLGLYIVQELLNFHESDIMLSQERNKYGRFYKFIIDFSKCLKR